jgi:hypothetical protein
MAATQVFRVFTLFVLIAFPSFESLAIADEVEVDKRSSLEYSDKFEGDIVLTSEQKAMLSGAERGAKTGLLNTKYRWPKRVVVPVTFDNSYSETNIS